MQTFFPSSNPYISAKFLDNKRLNKQILECDQIFRALEKQASGFTGRIGWISHPAVRMWKNNTMGLKAYRDICLQEWLIRGKNSTREHYFAKEALSKVWELNKPHWIGNEDFHASHRSNLLRKDPIWYGQFGWTEPSTMEYIWP